MKKLTIVAHCSI